MRVRAFPLAFLALSGGCSGVSSTHGPAQPVVQPPRGIVIKEQSNVCVRVHVDERIWRRTGLASYDEGLSGILTSGLRQLYEGRTSSFLPGPNLHSRFTSFHNPANPLCLNGGEDIYVTVNYVPRREGTPFIFTYLIEQGTVVRTGSVTRDLEEEWRTGALIRRHKTNPLAVAIGDDLKNRISAIFNLIADQNYKFRGHNT